MTTRSVDLLTRLLAFDTVSSQSNLALIGFVQQLLEAHGIATRLFHDATGGKANLFASVGPVDQPGLLLSGHTDVVPVEGQQWTVPPFAATHREGRIYGRGSCDMKGFIACAVNAMLLADASTLKRPLQLALSYDEEIGCVGVRDLIDSLRMAPIKPFLCLVGEPTGMQLALGHKGKAALRACCHGQEGHSALAPQSVNAIHLASDLIGLLRTKQSELVLNGARDAAYAVPYTTLHVGKIAGGKALNIVPNFCEVDFEIRTIAADNPDRMVQELREQCEVIVERAKATSPVAAIDLEWVNAYPGLDTPAQEPSVRWLHQLLGSDTPVTKVAFGTEGGLFAEALGVPVAVCGPGYIEHAHKPDEFVALEQLHRCDELLGTLLSALTL